MQQVVGRQVPRRQDPARDPVGHTVQGVAGRRLGRLGLVEIGQHQQARHQPGPIRRQPAQGRGAGGPGLACGSTHDLPRAEAVGHEGRQARQPLTAHDRGLDRSTVREANDIGKLGIDREMHMLDRCALIDDDLVEGQRNAAQQGP